jgi:hypothetical protein
MHIINFLLSIFCVYTMICPTESLCLETPWRPHVEQYNKEFFIQRLGWDPLITIYDDPKSSQVANNEGCTLYSHGWGESQKAIPIRQAMNLLPGTIIGFNFQDAIDFGTQDTKQPSIAKMLRNTSFGQENDCKALTLVLKLLDEADCPVIHFMGYSRGGATDCNTITRLKNYRAYSKFFHKLGISKDQAESILKRISRGTIVLDCPLLNMRVIMKYRFPAVCGFIDYILCPVVTLGKYIPWKEQAIDSAPSLKDCTVLVHFQKGDQVVTNLCDNEFYNALKSPSTHLIFGDDGGHFHRGQTLQTVLQSFRKKYNGPYYADALLLELGEQLLAHSQPETLPYS